MSDKIHCSCKELHEFVRAIKRDGDAGAKHWLKENEPGACAMDIIKVYHQHPDVEGKVLIGSILLKEIIECLL